jgi:osmoprotectant transport system substrate-binding protein
MDLGLLYRSLLGGQVDIVAGNATDGLLAARDLIVLRDDRHFFPPYQAVPIIRTVILRRYPEVKMALDELAGRISEQDMRRMNYAVDGGRRDPAAVVGEFRHAHGLD